MEFYAVYFFFVNLLTDYSESWFFKDLVDLEYSIKYHIWIFCNFCACLVSLPDIMTSAFENNLCYWFFDSEEIMKACNSLGLGPSMIITIFACKQRNYNFLILRSVNDPFTDMTKSICNPLSWVSVICTSGTFWKCSSDDSFINTGFVVMVFFLFFSSKERWIRG